MANVTFKLEADEADAVRGFLKLVEAQKKSEDQFQKGYRAGKQHHDMLKGLGGEIDSLIGKYIGIGAAIETARKALEYFHKEREAGSNRLKESEFTGSRLAQLANTPEQLKGMLAQAQKSSTQGGMALPQAQNLQFELESANIPEAREMIAGLYGIIEQPAEIARAIVTARNAFGKKARSVRQTLNEAKLASGPETIDLDQVLLNVTNLAPGTAQLGGTQEEAFSALAMLSGARKDPEQAATEIRAFMTQAMRKGLGGKGLFGALEAAQKRTKGMSDKQLIKFYEDQEALRGAATLAPRLDELRQRARDMEAQGQEGDNDQVAQMLGLRQALPELNAPRTSRAIEQSLAAARSGQFGTEGINADTAIQAIELESLNRSESPLRRMLRTTAASGAKALGASPETIIQVGAAMTGGTDAQGRTPAYDGRPGEQAQANKMLVDAIHKLIKTIERGGTLGPTRNRNQHSE